MIKIPRAEFKERKEFEFANKFIRESIEKIAKKYTIDTDETISLEVKANMHYKMVCHITKFFLSTLEMFTESDLKEINKIKGNIFILNKWLAIRQLIEDQLEGLMKGTWGIPSSITDTEEFKANVSQFESLYTKEYFMELLKQPFSSE